MGGYRTLDPIYDRALQLWCDLEPVNSPDMVSEAQNIIKGVVNCNIVGKIVSGTY